MLKVANIKKQVLYNNKNHMIYKRYFNLISMIIYGCKMPIFFPRLSFLEILFVK